MLGRDGFDERDSVELERRVRKSDYYRDLVEWCSTLPTPPEARPIGKEGLWNWKGVRFGFETDLGDSSVKRHLEPALESEGWRNTSGSMYATRSIFRRDNWVVEIEYNSDDADFTIYCGPADPGV